MSGTSLYLWWTIVIDVFITLYFLYWEPQNYCLPYLYAWTNNLQIQWTHLMLGRRVEAGGGGESRGGTSYSSFPRWPLEKTWKEIKGLDQLNF